jgi:hypothetical protein
VWTSSSFGNIDYPRETVTIESDHNLWCDADRALLDCKVLRCGDVVNDASRTVPFLRALNASCV